MEPAVLRATRLGPYRLREQLGAGAMGAVYLAEADEGPVALKLIHPHLLERSGYFKRFQREAEAGRRVEHPNVVRTLDSDLLMVEGEPYFFLVMEYVQGKTLRELLNEEGTLPEALVRELGRQIAAGLAAIHEAGIVHRDVKPENVLITNDHRVRIMDLGVARVEDAVTQLTQEGHFAGSLGYAAPEQFRTQTIGPAADLYALGVLLYELVAGTNPFRRDEAAAVMRAHLEDVPPSLEQLDPEVSLFFAELVATLLAKQTSERFDSADGVRAVLEEGEASAWWGARERLLLEKHTRRVRVPVRRETELYGREDNLALLQAAWQRALDGRGNTVLLEGEAGIGKSRLVDAFLGELDEEDALVLYGSYAPSGGMGAISDALVEHFGRADLEDALRPHLTVTPSLVPALAAVLKREVPPEGAPSVQGDVLHTVCVYLMRSLATERPLVWVIEDLHFADADSRRLGLALARAVEGHPILLCLTTRPGLPVEELEHFGRLENIQRTELARLGAREVIELLRDAFRSERLADKLGAKIAYKSDGVPFFVFEMIRGLREGQFIEALADGSYVETRQIDEIEVPSAVKELIDVRLKDLSQEERAILDAGAVIGFTFDPDLAAATLSIEPLALLQSLAEIERRSGIVLGVGAKYRFDHHQMQEVIYGELHERLRAEYHTAVAHAFASQRDLLDCEAGNIPGESAVFLATHHVRGVRPELARGIYGWALSWLSDTFRNRDALDLAERALGVPDLLNGDVRGRVLLRIAFPDGALARLGSTRGQLAALTEAEEIAEQLGDKQAKLCAVLNMSGAYQDRGHVTEVMECCERALALSLELGDRKSEASVTGNLGLMLWQCGRHTEAEIQHQRHLAISLEIGDQEEEALAAGRLGLVRASLGRLDEARGLHERSLTLRRRIRDRDGQVFSMGNLGDTYRRLGRLGKALECLLETLELSRTVGRRRNEAIAQVNLGQVWFELGEMEAAHRALEVSLDISREIDAGYVEGFALLRQARLADASSDVPVAMQLSEESLKLRRTISHGDGIVSSLLEVGDLRRRAGDAEGARAALTEAASLARRQGRGVEHAEAVAVLACLPGGDIEAARVAASEVDRRAGSSRLYWPLWRATHDPAYLTRAKRILDYRVEHAPEEYQESMLKNVRLNREIMEAWAEHVGGEQEATPEPS